MGNETSFSERLSTKGMFSYQLSPDWHATRSSSSPRSILPPRWPCIAKQRGADSPHAHKHSEKGLLSRSEMLVRKISKRLDYSWSTYYGSRSAERLQTDTTSPRHKFWDQHPYRFVTQPSSSQSKSKPSPINHFSAIPPPFAWRSHPSISPKRPPGHLVHSPLRSQR